MPSVRFFKSNENNLAQYLETNVTIKNLSVGHGKRKSRKIKFIVRQLVYNKLDISDVPQELKPLNKLEIALIFQQLLIQKNSYHDKRTNA